MDACIFCEWDEYKSTGLLTQECEKNTYANLEITQTEDAKIMREGVCASCVQCPPGDFLRDCGVAGFGVCAPCRKECEPGYHLTHSAEKGCANEYRTVPVSSTIPWLVVHVATADYSCSQCRTWQQDTSHYRLLVGCAGSAELVRWHPQQLQSSMQELQTEQDRIAAQVDWMSSVVDNPLCRWGGGLPYNPETDSYNQEARMGTVVRVKS